MEIMSLSARLSLDKDEFEEGAEEAVEKGKKLSDRLKDALTHAAGNIISDLLKSGWQAVKGLAQQAMSLAGELQQQVGGTEAVFRNTSHNIMAYAKDAWKTLGLSQTKYLAEANKMGSLLQGMGIAEVDAAQMTVEWMQRASDVASIMGIDVSDAMTAIEGAAKGNFTMMDNLGVAMNATTLNAYALEKGYDKTFEKMSQGEKIMLAYDYFMEKTANYAGNYTKENNTLAGSLTTLNAAWENVLSGAADGEELADALSAYIDSTLTMVSQLFPKVWSAIKKAAVKIWPKAQEMVADFFKKLPQSLGTVLTGMANGIIGMINHIFGLNIPEISEIKIPSWDEMRDWALEKINGIIDGINEFFGANIPKITTIKLPDVQGIINKAKEWWNSSKLGQAISNTCTWALSLFDKPKEALDPGKVREILGQWWTAARDVIASSCKWLLNIFTGVDGNEETVGAAVGRWWKDGGFGKLLGDVCSWTLQIFGFEKSGSEAVGSTIAELWEKSGWAQTLSDTCSWVLSLPEMPANEAGQKLRAVIGEWWDSIWVTVKTIFSWIFPEPGTPPDERSQAIADTINNWWNTHIKPLLDATVDFTVGLLGYDSIDDLLEHWATAIDDFAHRIGRDIALWGIEMAKPVADLIDMVSGKESGSTYSAMKDQINADYEAWKNGGAVWESEGGTLRRVAGSKEPTWWQTLVNDQRFITDAQTAAAMPMQNGQYRTKDEANRFVTDAQEMLAAAATQDQALSILSNWGMNPEQYGITIDATSAEKATAAVEETQDALTELDGQGADVNINLNYHTRRRNMQQPGNATIDDAEEDGSFAKGLDYVPHDDYLTRLHRGEAVLSGNEARAWREHGGRGQDYAGTGAVVSAIQGLSSDLQNLRLYVGERAFAGAVVDYSGRRMNDYLGSSDTRRRRGYGRR